MLLAAVEGGAGHAGEDAVAEEVAEGSHAAATFGDAGGGEFEGDTGAGDARDVLCAGALLRFLTAAVKELAEGRAAAEEEDAGPFRPPEFVGGEAEGIDAERFDIEGEPPGRLDGVGMEEDAVLMEAGIAAEEGGDLGDGL